MTFYKVLISIFSVLFLFSCDSPKNENIEILPNVIAEKVSFKSVLPFQAFVGRTSAYKDVIVNSRVTGELLSRAFEEGSNVKSGDVLYQIDPEKIEKQVRQFQALLKQHKASHQLANRNLLRGKELINSGAIGQVDFDKLKTNAIESLHVLEQTESALADAKLNLTYTTIRAPIDGRTGKSMVGVGEIITSNIAMVNIVELNPIRVDFQVSEATLNQIRSLNSQTGDSYKDISKLPVKIKLSDGAYFPELGFIDFYDNKVNPTTGTWNVRASFPNPRRDILPGQFVKVEVADAVKKQAILIPQQAVQEDQEGRFVMLINEHNIIEKRLLLLGQRYGINWEVNKGLKEGETIVVDGLQRIRTGIEVNVNYSHEPPFSNGSAKSKNNNQG